MKDRNKLGEDRPREMTSHDAHYNRIAIKRLLPGAFVRYVWRRENTNWSNPSQCGNCGKKYEATSETTMTFSTKKVDSC